MEIKLKKYEEIHILEVHGEMDLYNAHKLKDVFGKLLQKDVTKYVINLEHVDYIDSSGVGTLITIHFQLTKKGFPLVLTNIHGTVRRVLTLTKLNGFFPEKPTVEEAVRSMA